MKKKSIFLIVIVMFLLYSCTKGGGNNEKDSNEIQSNVPITEDENIETDSIPLAEDEVEDEIVEIDSTPQLGDKIVELKDFSFQLTDYYLVKSESDAVKDSLNVYEEVSNTSVDSTKLGFDIGFHGSNSEVSKRDSYLILKINYNPNKNNISQRDSVIPKMKISAVDNKGDDLILIHNSMKDKYIQVEDPIGILVFKMFGDTETIDFKFDGNVYELKLK